jgi:hypothetical protein
MEEGTICIQWKRIDKSEWCCSWISGIPATRAVKIRIEHHGQSLAEPVGHLIIAIEEFVSKVGGQSRRAQPGRLIEAGDGDCILEMIVSDGTIIVPLEERIRNALDSIERGWVLPAMPRVGSPQTLADPLSKQNIAFWDETVAELYLTVLARAGVTALDRRIFISYRRLETEPMAGQLFEALSIRNFSVFLDTVSVQPGVDFQTSLVEQLADKSMVVLLHSATFSSSQWTMAEADYVRARDLSLLVLRLPDVITGDPLERYYRLGDLVELRWEDIVTQHRQEPPYRLNESALDRFVEIILAAHDAEMIERLIRMRQRTIGALERHNITYSCAPYGASFYAESDSSYVRVNGQKVYHIIPSARPPGLAQLCDASTYGSGDQRVVIGHVAAFGRERLRQLGWATEGRNVCFRDIELIDAIAEEIKRGSL